MKNLWQEHGLMPSASLYHPRITYGGGGGGSTQVTGLPTWAEPYAKDAVEQAVNLQKQGGFSRVEQLTPEQLDSLSRSAELGQRGGVFDRIAEDTYGAAGAYRDAASGEGLFGANALAQQTEALEPAIKEATAALIAQQRGDHSRTGNLGGARADALTNRVAADTAAQLATDELGQRRGFALQGAQGTVGSAGALQEGFKTGADTIGEVGSAIQAQSQREGDAAYQGTQRLFGLLSSPAAGRQTVTTGGGGK